MTEKNTKKVLQFMEKYYILIEQREERGKTKE